MPPPKQLVAIKGIVLWWGAVGKYLTQTQSLQRCSQFRMRVQGQEREMSLGLKRRHKERIDSKQHVLQHSEN